METGGFLLNILMINGFIISVTNPTRMATHRVWGGRSLLKPEPSEDADDINHRSTLSNPKDLAQ
jgi:hypothetical protein